ncbi:EamA family transporter RarD [Vibrio sp. SM6]|uniref:EamA family transporter RarD n=1 Tax=Vibrio agarilyticus TaxID=2726741 RepID=A0A7X8TNU4_9VIBR|nr:EamA family transporter RarD [Vibrio agarilyticus]NLS12168.1 EamA family transporter RarD [Vibrio agarilyticus]
MNSIWFGNAMAAISFFIWGLLPLYYRLLPDAAMDELLALRIIGSVPVALLLVVGFTRTWPNLSRLIKDRRALFYAFVAGNLMCISWTAFTWALTNDRVMDASLGFFISPLAMVALGVFFLGDKLTLGKKLAIGFAVSGLLYQVVHYGQIPYVALTMGIFFALYGWCKKKVAYDWCTTLYLEVLMLTPFALLYLVIKGTSGELVSMSAGAETFWLYVGSAPVTLLPLIFYSVAIRLANMSSVGLMQYIEPSLQFLLAVFLFGEHFDAVKAVSFALIWTGLLFIILESLFKRQRPLAHP